MAFDRLNPEWLIVELKISISCLSSFINWRLLDLKSSIQTLQLPLIDTFRRGTVHYDWASKLSLS
jgi:hypothetical protein